MEAEKAELVQKEETFTGKEAELTSLSAELDEKQQMLKQEQAELARIKQEYEGHMREVATARDSLATLQNQLESEISKVVEQKNDLLPEYGLAEGDSGGQGQADRGVPVVDKEARKSLERFQKLCRDAKRRAVGAS